MNAPASTLDPIQAAQLELAGFLADVEKVLDSALPHARGDTLMGAARHLCMGGGGKRARPMLVRLFGDAARAPQEHLVEVAVAAELIHSASLLHDDVVDTGMFRRGRPTVNARWGNTVAVMSGDLLLSTALSRLKRMEARVMHEAVATVVDMTRSAIVEVESRGDLGLPPDRLRFIHEGKTGSLFGWCGAAAAVLAGNDDAAQRFSVFGRRLGIAFQIADDIRDLNGTDPGKPQYADIQARNISLPILIAAQKDDSLRRRLRDAWAFSAMTAERVRELGEAVLTSGALEASLERMDREIEAGIDALGPYAEVPGGLGLVGWARKLAASVRP
ncbi:MAG TPA: polyprenyl synthetase family protein [Myxococcaceae bacterium]|nr:polyprenyl synthetase family protein [Myxococcaceae bacterium]